MLIFLVIIVILGVFFVFSYNSLIVLKQRVDNAWSQVDVQLKRRYDLIPNLVNTVKGYAKYEKNTFENITQARSRAVSATSTKEQALAENHISSSLGKLFAVVENYPELKADANFRDLQKELTETESKIAFSRQFFNDTVQKYNIKTQIFPVNIIANIMGFKTKDFFDLDDKPNERDIVNIDLK